MSISAHAPRQHLQYRPDAYEFVIKALTYTQQMLNRRGSPRDEAAHVTGQELLEGIRQYAAKLYGMMAPCVFHYWGVHSTEDFGRIVFELVERGELHKTERDQLSDFENVYSFEEVFCRNYYIDASRTTT